MRVTIADIAEELGISANTVSKALTGKQKVSEGTKQQIYKTAERLGYKRNIYASRLASKQIKIGVLVCGYDEHYYRDTVLGIKKALAEIADYKVTYDLRLIKVNTATETTAFSILDEFCESGCDGILINDFHSKDLAKTINSLTDKQIKVALINYDVPESNRLFASVNDTSIAAEMAAQVLGMILRFSDQKSVVVFTGDMKSKSQYELFTYFSDNVTKYGLTISSHITSYGDMYKLLDSTEPPAGIYVSHADCIPLCEYFNRSNSCRKPALIVSDLYDELMPYLDNGTVDATIFQDPSKQAYDAVINLYEAITENAVVPNRIKVHPILILKSNSKQYLQRGEHLMTEFRNIENTFVYGNSGYKVLFVGNSIALHGVKEDIGWYSEHGMAASKAENDYVHLVVKKLSEKHETLSYCICQAADWERNYLHGDEFMREHEGYQAAADFDADLMIVKLLENVPADGFSPEIFDAQYRSLLRYLNPSGRAKVIIAGPFWEHVGNDILIKIASENGYPFISLCDLGGREEMKAIGLFENPDVANHPGDLGMRMIAERIIETIER